MRKMKKLGADAVQEAAMGHNAPPLDDKLLKEHVQKVAKLQNSMEALNGKIKEELRTAKDNGFKKMSIRAAVKELRMTAEQRQSREEIDAETKRITRLCADLPLFSGQSEEAEAA